MSFDLGLEGKRALVTDGTKGTGAAVVRAVADAGARVAATARTMLGHGTGNIHYVAADLLTPEGCTKVAGLILFLASLRAADITGTEHMIDDGTVPTA